MADLILVDGPVVLQGTGTAVTGSELNVISGPLELPAGNRFYGSGTISGTVKIDGVLGRRRVSLLERESLLFLDHVYSDDITGEYQFTGLDPNRNYLVICEDDAQVYNAAVADWVQIDAN